ncbi:hypothetical protein D3C85_792210 [compost metagenome]
MLHAARSGSRWLLCWPSQRQAVIAYEVGREILLHAHRGTVLDAACVTACWTAPTGRVNAWEAAATPFFGASYCEDMIRSDMRIPHPPFTDRLEVKEGSGFY